MPRKFKEPPKPDICPWDGGNLLEVTYWYGSTEHYDGVSEYACIHQRTCGYRVGRWSGEVIPPGYIESRFGRNGIVPTSSKEKK